MPSRQRDRLKRAALRWQSMTPAERDALTAAERSKLETQALLWHLERTKQFKQRQAKRK